MGVIILSQPLQKLLFSRRIDWVMGEGPTITRDCKSGLDYDVYHPYIKYNPIVAYLDLEYCQSIKRAGVKFGINFASCSENGNFAIIAITSGIYPKISLLPVLSQINTIASFVKVKISDFQTIEYALLRVMCGMS